MWTGRNQLQLWLDLFRTDDEWSHDQKKEPLWELFDRIDSFTLARSSSLPNADAMRTAIAKSLPFAHEAKRVHEMVSNGCSVEQAICDIVDGDDEAEEHVTQQAARIRETHATLFGSSELLKQKFIDWLEARDRSLITGGALSASRRQYLLAQKFWLPEEAVAISMGLDPDVANAESVLLRPVQSRLATDFLRRCLLLKAELRANRLGLPLSPKAFLNWARANDLMLEAEGARAESQAVSAQEEPQALHQHTKRLLQDFLLASTLLHYKLSPDYSEKDNETVFAALEKDMRSLGLSGSAKALKFHIRQALAHHRKNGGDSFTEKVRKELKERARNVPSSRV